MSISKKSMLRISIALVIIGFLGFASIYVIASIIINGSEDRRTTVADSRALFNKANEPKQLWIIDSAAHVNLHKFAGAEYEQRVLAFFESHL